MQDAFAILVWVVAGVGVLVALVTLAGTARGYRDIGGSGLTHDSDGGPAEPGAASDAERDEEIRQMLDARNARRERRGEPPMDVDAELAALARPATDDAALREEVRQLVVARNHRRVRAGKAPLDVEAEVERRIRELN